jgi:hypothetical protein
MLLSKAFKLIFVAVSVNTVPAIAGVLYSSLPNLDVAPDGNVWNSTPCSGVKCNLVADKFSLQTLSLITEIQFSVENNYGESAGPESFKDGVDLDIWTNDGGTPGAISVSEGTNVEQYTQTSFGTTIVTAPLSWIELPAAEYWIGPVPGNNNLDLLGIPGYVGGSGSLSLTVRHIHITLCQQAIRLLSLFWADHRAFRNPQPGR